MGPTTFALCQKPVIGMVMFVTFLCYFPNPIEPIPVSLEEPGLLFSSPFSIPVDHTYVLNMNFKFASSQVRLQDQVAGRYSSEHCAGKIDYDAIPARERKSLGRPISFRVVVRRAEDKAVVFDDTRQSLCTYAHGTTSSTRRIAGIALSRGDYVAEVFNLEAQKGLEGIETSIALNPPRMR